MTIRIARTKSPLARAFAEPPSIEEEVEFKKLTIVEELLQFMKRNGIKRTELAERMGVRPSRITAMLDGTGNLTIETLVRAGRAVGADLQQTFVPKGKKGEWITEVEVKSKGKLSTSNREPTINHGKETDV